MRTAFLLATATLVSALTVGPFFRPREVAAAPPATGNALTAAPIVIPDCRLTVIEKQEVPSKRAGTLLVLGTELPKGEQVPPEQQVVIQSGAEEKRFRRLREGDPVQAGQLLGLLDEELTRHEHGIKLARLAASRAEHETAVRTCEEGRRRYETQLNLQKQGMGVIAEEDVRASKLTWERAFFEELSKRQAVAVAELEVSQLETVRRMHQLRSAISGVVKAIHKREGEAVREAETLLEVQNLARLRVEGQVDVQHLPRLQRGMRVAVEWTRPVAPCQSLSDHLQAVTEVAVGQQAGKPLLVSASEDGTVRVWDPVAQRLCRLLEHPVAVHAVACTPPGSPANLCLTGAADGKARLWNLDGAPQEPARELTGTHRGAVLCATFSPDGQACVTGGEDRDLCCWDCATGKLRYRFPAVHGGGITMVQFLSPERLLSVGRDNTVRLWQVLPAAARLETTLDRRTGDVPRLAASPDGKQVLFDQGKVLRLRSLPAGISAGSLESGPAGSPFATLALFSPDGKLILTASGGADRLQLWRTPGPARGRVVAALLCPESTVVTSAAFAADGSFVVAGTREGRVLVWPVPTGVDLDPSLTAEITLIERSLETSTRQVRIWAEVANPAGALLPGATVTLVVEPGADR